MTKSSNTVVLTTPARLHFGFLDLAHGDGKEEAGKNDQSPTDPLRQCGGKEDAAKNDQSPTDPLRQRGGLGPLRQFGGLGPLRRFGGLGMALAGCSVRLSAQSADQLYVEGPGASTVRDVALRFLHAQGWDEGARITIEDMIPRHAGLGSGTQLALATGALLTALHGDTIDARSIAATLGRGRRSGIGIGAFEQGGLLVDSSGTDGPAPIIIRHPWPAEWRIVLIFDDVRQGVHGGQEQGIFTTIPPYAPRVSENLCRTLVRETLPSLVEKQFSSFSRSITHIQNIVGDHFARYQGARYASPTIASILEGLAQQGWEGYGQSSWGPTAFILCPDAAAATHAIQSIRQRHGKNNVRLSVHRGRNRGYRLERRPDRQ